jgi:XTP/dITP diphosphohydrolase
MRRLYVATSNRGKLRDFQAAAAPYSIEIQPIPNFDALPPVAEDAPDFEGNARKKAEFYSLYSNGEPGAPGVISARYAAGPEHPNATDADNNAKLLRELENLPDAQRSARFVCLIALAASGETLATFRGEAPGQILHNPRGTGGFGYDPLFFFPSLNKTFAELRPEEKSLVSHRGQAFRRAIEWCKDRLTS